MPKLKPKQEAFVNEYLIDMNGARAARAAGYSENSARITSSKHLLTNANVKQRIAEKLQERAAVADGSFEWMESKLIHAAERCSSEDDFNPNGLVQTVGLLAKLKGFMNEKIQLQAEVNSRHSIDMVRVLETDDASQSAFELLMQRKRRELLPAGSEAAE